MIDLKREYGDRYKITTDPSLEPGTSRSERAWYYRIPATYGWIGVCGETTLLAHCNAGRVIPKLLAIEGVTPRQVGDGEVNAAFDVERFDQVARILKAHRRRRMSPEAREAAAARLAGRRKIPASERAHAAPSPAPSLAR
jgi:hypothetical protein